MEALHAWWKPPALAGEAALLKVASSLLFSGALALESGAEAQKRKIARARFRWTEVQLPPAEAGGSHQLIPP